MKRIFLAALFTLYASQAIGAMTCVDSGQITPERSGTGNTLQVVTCTFDTTPGTAVATIPTGVMARLDNKFCWIDIVPGATGPTDNSDLQIVDSRGLTIISASGSGLNVIDNTASTFNIMGEGEAGNVAYLHPHAPYQWTVTVTNNAVNNSSFLMYIEAIQ